MRTLTLEQFRATVEAGGVLGVNLKAQGGAFYVDVETRRGEAVLVTAREKKPRAFADPRRALMLLRDIGIREAHIDTKSWRPEEQETLRPSRPDRSAAMKDTFDAAAQSRWMAEQVQQAAARADRPDAVWHDAETVFDALDKDMEARIAGQAAG